MQYLRRTAAASVCASSPIDAGDADERQALGGGSQGGNKDWVDPYVGVRVQHPLSDRWALTGYADVGGFGAGSDLTWQAAVGASYRISDRMNLKFGYRYLYVDYDKNGYVFEMTQDGLYVGLGIRF